MNARDSYEQFDAWLWAKYGEVLRAWNAETDAEVRARYEAMMMRISKDFDWTRDKSLLAKLQENTRELQAMLK